MVALALALWLSLFNAGPANARPEYAAREHKACQYCHVSASPGYAASQNGSREPLTRNSRGDYYETHSHSFEGYKELAVMGRKSPPVFHLLWKDTLHGPVRRLAVGDLTGDGKSRLITLSSVPENAGQSSIAVLHWDGKSFVSDFQAVDPVSPDRLAAGRLAGKTQPFLAVTQDAVWKWASGALQKLPVSLPGDILGTTRLIDGTEKLLLSGKDGTVKGYTVLLGAASASLSPPSEVPASSQVTWGDMHGSPAAFAQMGMPDFLTAGGVIGLWDARKFGTVFLYYAGEQQDFELAADPANPKSAQPRVQFKSSTGFVGFRDPHDASSPVLWMSPPLSGKVLDVVVENPLGTAQPGLLVLTRETAGNSVCNLYFFALD